MTNYIEYIFTNYAIPGIESLLVILVGIIAYHLFQKTVRKLSKKGFIAYQLQVMLIMICKILVVVIVFLTILGLMGVSVSAFWAALSGVLVLLSLGFVAVWSVLSNILCSILLVIFAPFRIGDEIEVQDTSAAISMRGRVLSMNMMFTTIESDDEDDEQHTVMVRIPNNLFFQKYVRRWEGESTRSLKSYLAKQRVKLKEEEREQQLHQQDSYSNGD